MGLWLCWIRKSRKARPSFHPDKLIQSSAMTEFEAGTVYAALQTVALGSKPAASGWIRADSQDEFVRFVYGAGFSHLHVGFGSPQGNPAVIEWRVSRFAWGLRALEWLSAGGSQVLGDFHLHWIQGLLYGYSADEIDRYLATLASQGSSSQPSRPRDCTAETALP